MVFYSQKTAIQSVSNGCIPGVDDAERIELQIKNPFASVCLQKG